jgi:hypothetical protein
LTALALRAAPPRFAPGRTITRLQHGLMWLVGAAGGIVVIEPAPYEFVVVLAMVVFLATGMPLRAAHIPLLGAGIERNLLRQYLGCLSSQFCRAHGQSHGYFGVRA